jgi:cephalosporin-C deacetylase-like acetyl esterase
LVQAQPAFKLPDPATPADSLRRAFYAYDVTLPLNAEVKQLETTAYGIRYHLAYDSANDQRVTAIFSLPRRFKEPHPAILLMHGSGGNKDVDYIQAASQMLNSQGYATLSIDSQYKGERARPGKSGELQPDSYTTRDAWTQTVIDLRRAVDYLYSRKDIDTLKIGYLGVSMGGMLGAVLGGVESRISCFFLAVPGGGIVNAVKHIDRYPNLKARFQVEISPEVMRRIEDIAAVIDPIYFVGNILPRPLMITVGIHDELIPAEMSTAIIEAAHAQPDNVKRVNSGHIPPPTVIAYDVRNFFVQHLGRPDPTQ